MSDILNQIVAVKLEEIAAARKKKPLEAVRFDAETRVQNQLLQDSPFAQTFQSQVKASVQRAKAYDPLD